ncbi:hypothetical protein JHK82_024636 [Glycine max]|nr:hypothetical protein JHK85_025240 [Glycine max]KAG5012480.1 hypothetical protein JHK86_024741 [Glycine max]KAG5133448.1 hypothetical protein JHK82_024636 [Glycine max]
MEVLHFLQLTNSPMSLLAPQVPNLSGVGLALVSPPSCVVEEQEVGIICCMEKTLIRGEEVGDA